MRIVQSLSYPSIVQVGTTRLMDLSIPQHAPAGLKDGVWQIGWLGWTSNCDRLGVRWSGVRPFSLSYFSIEVRQSEAGDVLWSKKEGQFPPQAAGELSKHFTSLLPHDVLLDFPRPARQLWCSERILSSSPYFSTLFSSTFSEARPGTGQASGSSARVEASQEDSDDELDNATHSEHSAPSPHLPAHKTVTITEVAYSTYLAVICYIQSGQTAFAPLTSSFRTPGKTEAEATSSRRTALLSSPSSSVSSPLLPVSPKSVYRLSHLLELPALSSLALANFRSQLTADNVAYELFSNTAICYDEILEAALDFTLKHMKEVFESEGMKRMEEKAKSGELTGEEGAVWAKLATRMAKEK
ncbi:hypothetical protein JCM10213v2_004341 [Rhodosporidiobolus nylandii]